MMIMTTPQVQGVILSICVVIAHWKQYTGGEKLHDTDTLTEQSGYSYCVKIIHHHSVPYPAGRSEFITTLKTRV